jgi:hypothetical protein
VEVWHFLRHKLVPVSIRLSGGWDDSNPDLHYPFSARFKDEIKPTCHEIYGPSSVSCTEAEGRDNYW